MYRLALVMLDLVLCLVLAKSSSVGRRSLIGNTDTNEVIEPLLQNAFFTPLTSLPRLIQTDTVSSLEDLQMCAPTFGNRYISPCVRSLMIVESIITENEVLN